MTLFRSALHALAFATAVSSIVAAPPNVLFIIANSQNCDLGCYGSSAVKTPNLDQLAARGLRFTRAYCQNTSQGASKLSMFTGLTPRTLGVMSNYRYAPELPKNAFTLPRWLKDNGFFTAKAGRFFQGDDYALSWNDSLPAPTEEMERALKVDTPVSVPVRRKADDPKEQLGETLAIRTTTVEGNAMPDGVVAANGAELLRKAASAGKPFFIGVGFHMPDFRHYVPKSWLDKYPSSDVSLPDVDDTSDVPGEAKFGSILPERPVTPEERKQFIAGYRAMTAYMDSLVGELLRTLDELKLTGNTLVIFTSSRGYLLGESGDLWGARCLFEQASHVPLIMAGPRVEARGQACNRVVELMDIYPTLTELCGLKTPRVMEGASFAALLRQPNAPSSDPALTWVQNYGPHDGVALRTEFASYVRWTATSVELYNRQADPLEKANVAAEKSMSGVLRKMESALEKSLPKR